MKFLFWSSRRQWTHNFVLFRVYFLPPSALPLDLALFRGFSLVNRLSFLLACLCLLCDVTLDPPLCGFLVINPSVKGIVSEEGDRVGMEIEMIGKQMTNVGGGREQIV